MNGIDEEEIDQEQTEPGIPLEGEEQAAGMDAPVEVDQAIPLRPQVPVPQPPPLVMRGPVQAPGSSPITAPVNPNLTPLTPQQAQQNEMWRRLQYATADAPFKEAEAAVNAALKFQSTRGYQQDIAAGVPAAEALAKWAPTMFGGPKAGSMSGAASLIRATRPPADKVMDIGGQAMRYDPATKTMVPLTQPKVVAPKTDPFALQQHASLLGEIRRTESELDKEVDLQSDNAKALQEKLRYLRNEAQKVREASRSGGATPGAKVGRVRVKSPDGKIGSIPASQLEAALAAGYTKM